MAGASDHRDIGAELRQARTARGLTLRDLADRTKISVSTLQALERNDFERVPSGVFARGFLHSYAREVGLVPADVLRQYRDQYEAPPPEEGDGPAPDSSAAPVRAAPTLSGLVTPAVLVVATALYVALVMWPAADSDRPRAAAGGVADSATPAARDPERAFAAVATTGRLENPPPAAPATGLRMEIRATGPCWVAATVDGRREVYRLLQAGDRQTLDARSEIRLRIGDAGAFTYTINGLPGRPLGGTGEAVSARVTADNFAELALP